METAVTSVSFAEKISMKLKKAQQEIEELAVQLALGKAEAGDKFEEIKKQFSVRVNEWRPVFANLKSLSKATRLVLQSHFGELQVQLTLGKAEGKDMFEEQKKKILDSIHIIEVEIKKNPTWSSQLLEFKNEIEKFKLKLEILKLKFELKKFEVKDDFKNAMSDAGIKIDKLFRKVEEKWDATKEKYADFSDEIELSYKHLKKAVETL